MSCGCCSRCQSGLQVYCDHFLRLNLGLGRMDGSPTLQDASAPVSSAFFGQSSFATCALANQRNAIRVPADIPLELLGPLGCGIQTGAGTVFNVLRPKPGSTLAVFGTGPVGMAAIMAARAIGCASIIAVDIKPNRLELARELGATHVVHNEKVDAVSAIQDQSGGRGVDYSVETTAIPRVIRQAVESLTSPGTCALVGLSPLGSELSLDINHLFYGRCVRGVIEGESVPSVLIPAIIELWRQGRFPFDRLIRTYDFKDINQAALDMERGETLKPVLRIGC